MKFPTLSILTFFMFLPFIGSSQLNYGVGLTYVADGSTLGAQAKFCVDVSDVLRGAASLDYYFEDGSLWDINADVQYKLATIGDETHIYPFAGLHLFKLTDDIGINLGVFAQFPISDSLKLYLEPKYVLSSFESLQVSAGVFF